ncbi:MAG: hypothetical protein Fur0017_02380 [Anaerolineales bacterium]
MLISALASEAAMKRLLVLTASLFLLTACANQAPAESIPTAVSVVEIPAQLSDVVVASAKVEPANVSELGFTISAFVKEIYVKEGDQVQAGDVLITLNMPDLEFSVIAAENDYIARAKAAELQQAQKVLYVDPRTGKKSWYSLPREVYLKALAQADQSKAAWDTASAELAQATLTAPFDGTVVDIAVTPGELVQVNQVVLTLADLNSLQATTTDLSERDIARIKIGQTADVHIEALDMTITGRVIRISPIAKTIGGDVVYPVTIKLNEQPEGLLWGMSAEIEIRTE